MSAPLGTGAPVKILTASALSCPRKLLPGDASNAYEFSWRRLYIHTFYSISIHSRYRYRRLVCLARTSTAVTLFMADVSEVSSVETTEISLIIFSSALSTDNRDLSPATAPIFHLFFQEALYC